MTEPVTDPASQEQPVPDTADTDQPVAEPEHDFQEPLSSGDHVTVEKVQTSDGSTYAETRDTATAGEREDNSGLVGATEPATAAQPIGATSNESPVLPASAQAGAAKAHAVLGHLVKVAQAAQAEIERYVPAELVAAAERDAALFVRSVL